MKNYGQVVRLTNGKTVIFESDGVKTTATLLDKFGLRVCKASARCHPTDEFNFDTGKLVSLIRLMIKFIKR